MPNTELRSHFLPLIMPISINALTAKTLLFNLFYNMYKHLIY